MSTLIGHVRCAGPLKPAQFMSTLIGHVRCAGPLHCTCIVTSKVELDATIAAMALPKDLAGRLEPIDGKECYVLHYVTTGSPSQRAGVLKHELVGDTLTLALVSFNRPHGGGAAQSAGQWLIFQVKGVVQNCDATDLLHLDVTHEPEYAGKSAEDDDAFNAVVTRLAGRQLN